MTTHQLRSSPSSFSSIWDGAKTFDIRRQDRDFQIGDVLDLREWQGSVEALQLTTEGYSGRQIVADIVFLTPGGNWGLPIGLCVLGLSTRERNRDVHDAVADDIPTDSNDPVSDVEIFSCRCGGRVRLSARGEPVADSLRFAMHTKPACPPFEAKAREFFALVVEAPSTAS